MIKEAKNMNDIFYTEGAILTEPDIFYNKDKFDSGKINKCFITGYSGSGKTSMMHTLMDIYPNSEGIELDDVLDHRYFTDAELRDYSLLLYSFFKGPGRKYRFDTEDEYWYYIHKMKEKDPSYNYSKEVLIDFIKYAIKYPEPKNRKIIIEGVWLFFFEIPPSTFDNCAVFIKGTGGVKSSFRATKREFDKGDTLKDKIKNGYRQGVSSVSFVLLDTKKLKKYIDYFKRKCNETK